MTPEEIFAQLMTLFLPMLCLIGVFVIFGLLVLMVQEHKKHKAQQESIKNDRESAIQKGSPDMLSN